jgi:hypothetical protein
MWARASAEFWARSTIKLLLFRKRLYQRETKSVARNVDQLYFAWKKAPKSVFRVWEIGSICARGAKSDLVDFIQVSSAARNTPKRPPKTNRRVESWKNESCCEQQKWPAANFASGDTRCWLCRGARVYPSAHRERESLFFSFELDQRADDVLVMEKSSECGRPGLHRTKPLLRINTPQISRPPQAHRD